MNRPRWGVALLVAGLQGGLAAFLLHAFAPDFSRAVTDRALTTFAIEPSPSPTPTPTPPPRPTPPPTPPPEPRPTPDPGAAGNEGRKATPRPVTAPVPRIVITEAAPAPTVAATGDDYRAGAGTQGDGPGAGGIGEGPGSGRGGNGRGGVPVTDPVKIAGDINSARDYPRASRDARLDQSVTIYVTVGIDGRASNCRIAKPSPDPVADRITCQLAVERFRFRPARDADGRPVSATYGWVQRWFLR